MSGFLREKGRYIFPYPSMAIVAEPISYEYGPVIFRPPPESYSLILQATIGCPWNRCLFCGTYKLKDFRPRSKEIIEDIQLAKKYYEDKPRRVFLSDANSLALKTERLIEICNLLFKTFINLERISSYGSARFILRKGSDDLKSLFEAGLKKVYMGLETGDDDLLKNIDKGVTSEEMMLAAESVKDSGMELSVTVIQGIGGKGSWKRNASKTAKVLNRMKPHETRLHNLVIHSNSPLHEKADKGEFIRASRDEVLEEMTELIRLLDYKTEIQTYGSNYLRPGLLGGRIPEDKNHMLEILDFALHSPDREIFLQSSRQL